MGCGGFGYFGYGLVLSGIDFVFEIFFVVIE